MQVLCEWQFAGRIALQEVEDGCARRLDLRFVGDRVVVVRGEARERRFRLRATRVLGHERDLLARRDVLEFHVVHQQAAHGQRRVERERGDARTAGRAQAHVRARVEAEALERALHERLRVARHHAEVVARAIAYARRQHHFDVPRRAFRISALQFAVLCDLHRGRAVHCSQHVRLRSGNELEVVVWTLDLRGDLAEFDVERVRKRRPERRSPRVEGRVEVIARIAFAARV